jgi:tetratricopeptide (TPR) repeat protein
LIFLLQFAALGASVLEVIVRDCAMVGFATPPHPISPASDQIWFHFGTVAARETASDSDGLPRATFIGEQTHPFQGERLLANSLFEPLRSATPATERTADLPHRKSGGVSVRRKRPLIERLNRRMIANGLNVALGYLRRGKLGKAVATLRFLAGCVPHTPLVQIRLAVISLQAGEPYFAQQALQRATAGALAKPSFVARTASAQIALDDLDGAEQTLSAAVEQFPKSWVVRRLLGVLYSQKSQTDCAIACFQSAIGLAPTIDARIAVMHSLADLFSDLGRRGDATAILEDIIALAPDNSAAHARLVSCQHDMDCNSEAERKLLSMLRSASPAGKRKSAHYALGRLYDRSQRAAEAFAHFHLANELRAVSMPPWDFIDLRKSVDGRIEIFGREFVANLSQHGSSDESQIAIVGMPRSGTTLVEQILSSHSAITGLGERTDIHRLTGLLRWTIGTRKLYPWCARKLSPTLVRALAEQIANARHADAGRCTRTVTKLPEDFWELGLLAILFPNVRIIHCRRHPIDTCLSCFMQEFNGIPYATSLTLLSEVYNLYSRIMEHWRSVLQPSSIMDLSYEALVERPEHLVRQMCAFCGVPFEDNCLNFKDNPRRVTTASQWQVRRPLYRTSVQRWEQYREFLGPLLSLNDAALK